MYLLWFAGKKFRKKMTNFNQNILNYLGLTSLNLASSYGHLPIVELLLDRGSNIDQKDNNGEFL